MNKRTKTILTTASLALVLAGTGAGVATAQTSTTPTPSGTASSPTPTPAATTAKHPHHKSGLRGRVEHGELPVHTKTGDKTLDTQRGVVTAITAGSVTVTSKDGFSATYTLNPTTKVHKAKQTTTQITTNDRVRVQANKTGTTATATRIGDAGPTQ